MPWHLTLSFCNRIQLRPYGIDECDEPIKFSTHFVVTCQMLKVEVGALCESAGSKMPITLLVSGFSSGLVHIGLSTILRGSFDEAVATLEVGKGNLSCAALVPCTFGLFTSIGGSFDEALPTTKVGTEGSGSQHWFCAHSVLVQASMEVLMRPLLR